MYEYQRRIINEGIKHGATKHPSGIGVQKEIQSEKWDDTRDGWEGKQDIEEVKKVVENDEEGDDYNADMAIAQLKIVVEKANDLLSMLTLDTELETWVQSKITMAEDYITTVRDYVKHGGEEMEEAVIDEAQAVSGKYRFNSFKEGSISGWKLSVQGKGEVGFMEEPAKKNTRTSISPHKLFLYGKKEGEPDFVMSLWPGKETRIVAEREMRYAPRQLFNAVAMWMDKYGKKMVK
jgi:hypothetical protein